MRRGLALPALALVLVLGGALAGGCAGPAGGGPSYSVSRDGFLALSCPPPAGIRDDILERNASLTVSRVTFRNLDEEIFGLLAAPEKPRGAVILAPGAGVTKEAERERVAGYALAGCAALVLDLRGNVGETGGVPFDPDLDFMAFNQGAWPGFYSTACDLSAARGIVAGRWAVPAYAMGASNGGRYAAIAAAGDPGFAGYIGVSTSGFGLAGMKYTGNASRFLLSIDPDHALGRISPRPVWIFHSRGDPVIPFEQGEELFGHAGEPKEFIVFNGTHGENDEVDRVVTGICAPG